MNPTIATVATFALGIFCGYLLRKNWYLVHNVLGTKPNKKSNIKKDNEPDKGNSKEKSVPKATSKSEGAGEIEGSAGNVCNSSDFGLFEIKNIKTGSFRIQILTILMTNLKWFLLYEMISKWAKEKLQHK